MKIISYIFSTLYGLTFYVLLLIFHPLQWLFLKFGYLPHKVLVDVLNWLLVKSLFIIGNTVKYTKHYPIPENTTIIFAANHQSMLDIPPIIWYFRKHHPKFVAKIELAKGTPSVSFNLKHGGAALIDRKDPKQALTEMQAFGKRIHDNTWSAAIFPEGTRSRTGVPKKFSLNGLKMLIRYNPEAYIVPVTINNSWKMYKYGKFPMGMFNRITIESFEPIPLKDADIPQVLADTERIIKEHVKL